jgi:hypothetical protein
VRYKTREVMHGYMLSAGTERGGGALSLILLNQNKHPFNKYCISIILYKLLDVVSNQLKKKRQHALQHHVSELATSRDLFPSGLLTLFSTGLHFC